MAEVWEARRESGDFDQVAALKLLKRGMDSEEIVRRFVRERQILARLEHPGIARLLDGGLATDGRPYLVMEKVEGLPITAWCRERDIDLAGRLLLLLDVCDAVAAAHRQLVVHRDLKPSNILVDAAGRVRLLDFGIAKLLEDEAESADATRTGLRLLTPAYAAPEQILGEPVSTATDVYALGALAYELVAGRVPHRRKGTDLASAVAVESVERPSTAVLAAGEAIVPAGAARRRWSKRIAGDLDTILLRALQREPGRRYASVEAFADDVRRFLEGRPIAARRDSTAYRAKKFVGRHQWGVAAAAVVALALAGGVAATAWQAERARTHARAAEANARRAERVQRFLIEVFRSADPGRALGAEVTARQILAAGVAGVEKEVAAEPQVAADLYDALAEIHHELGLVERAAALGREALALRESRLARDPARLGETLRRLASIRLDGEEVGALELAERAWGLVVESGGSGSLAGAATEATLAAALANRGRHESAIDHQRSALAVYRAVAGQNDPETATAMIGLAELLEPVDAFDEAGALYEEALPILAAALGDRHPRVSIPRRDYAGLLDRMGRTGEAEPMFREALAAQREVLGPRHWQVGETLFSYGLLLNSTGRLAEAEAMFREALAIDGPAGVEAHLHRYLGLNLSEQRRFDEAAEELARAVAAYRALEGADSVEGWRAAANLGHVELRRGALTAAERALREAVAALERTAGPRSYAVRLPLRQLGETLVAAGRVDEGIAILRRTRALEVELFSTEDHGDIGLTDLQLSRALARAGGAGSPAESRRYLDEAIDLLTRHKPASRALAEALADRGRLASAG